MARWAPQRKDVLEALADEILHNYPRGRVVVAIDGRDGAGTTVFADDLAEVFRRAGHDAFRASIDDFHRPRVDRYAAGRDSGEGYYADAFDYSVLRRVLIEPFRMGGSTGFVTAAFDVEADTPIEPRWMTGPADAILIVDGVFLNRPETRGLWNFSVWLEVPLVTAYSRTAELDGTDPDPESETNRRSTRAQELYDATRPSAAASAIIDNRWPEHPRRIFADSC